MCVREVGSDRVHYRKGQNTKQANPTQVNCLFCHSSYGILSLLRGLVPAVRSTETTNNEYYLSIQ
jgi:hypothetical protein